MSKRADAAMFDEIVAELRSAMNLEPGEFTIQMVAQETGASEITVRKHLRRRLKAGQLTSRLVIIDGKERLAYREAP